ncbi:hypothetical protein [Alienimonas chondri]|uniref:DUF4190 domain-containing protein n=1 Tax=Alienimonas chondri TaxID=2681879 RepID=A0ABX1VB34_9PLAN|nr:hypothetical protein [Alienimonas chondri]NNJ25151.1 hypothetical protein [Alienimonas chondri]
MSIPPSDETVLISPPPPEPPPPRLARRYGPSNAAGFGGWCGTALPTIAVGLWWSLNEALSGRAVMEGGLLGAAYGLTCTAFLAVVPGYFCGWVGGAIGRWLHRRRGAEWPLRRAEFAGGFAAATALVAGIVWLIVVLNS